MEHSVGRPSSLPILFEVPRVQGARARESALVQMKSIAGCDLNPSNTDK